MFVCSGRLEYGWEAHLATLDDARYAEFRRVVRVRELPEALPSDCTPEERAKPLKALYLHEMPMTSDVVNAWNEIGVNVSVSRVAGLASNSRDIHSTIYQISVANVGLMQVQSVKVLEDCCTDVLQDELSNGWRILAVCPPNDARRPSYVVGHVQPPD